MVKNDTLFIAGYGIGIFVFGLFLLVFFPILQIWSINTLFKTNIEYSYLTWCAVVLLNSTIRFCTYNKN